VRLVGLLCEYTRDIRLRETAMGLASDMESYAWRTERALQSQSVDYKTRLALDVRGQNNYGNLFAIGCYRYLESLSSADSIPPKSRNGTKRPCFCK
jgi:hypothetical protein